MRFTTCTLFFLFNLLKIFSQTNDPSFAKTWKSYYSDDISFVYLKLNADGTGKKLFGQTIHQKDTLYTDNSQGNLWWFNIGDTIFLTVGKYKSMYPNYKCLVSNKSKKSMDVLGYRLIGSDSALYTKNELLSFRPTVDTFHFVNIDFYEHNSNWKQEECYFSLDSWKAESIDSVFTWMHKKAYNDIIPFLYNCNSDCIFTKAYPDPAYKFKLPSRATKISYGVRNNNLYINFTDEEVTNITIHYNFKGDNKGSFFENLKANDKCDSVIIEDKKIYLFKNWQEKLAGEYFINNVLSISYYTTKAEDEGILRECITSFTFE